jgi:hypothetical protein
MRRIDAEKKLEKYNRNGTDIYITHNIKNIRPLIVNIACNLLELDFIKYMRITNDSISASNEISETRVKNPIVKMDHPTAIGIKIVFHYEIKSIQFYEINSPIKGCGSKMVNCVFKDFPQDWQACVVMDWSEGFWDKMQERYSNISWM